MTSKQSISRKLAAAQDRPVVRRAMRGGMRGSRLNKCRSCGLEDSYTDRLCDSCRAVLCDDCYEWSNLCPFCADEEEEWEECAGDLAADDVDD
jgi:hypothetical protein